MAQANRLGLLTTDPDLIVTGWNSWLASVTGIDETTAIGSALFSLIAPDRRELYREVAADVIQRGTTRVLAPTFHHFIFSCAPASPSRHFDRMQQHVTVAPLRSEADPAGIMVTVEDMTPALDQERDLAQRLAANAAESTLQALTALGAQDWQVRRAAVRALQHSVTPADVVSLFQSVEQHHQDLAVLNSALRVLLEANVEVLDPLFVLLRDPHPNLRMHAALALGGLGDPSAAAPLVSALDDPDDNVKFHAIEALGRLGVPAGVEPLTAIVQSGDFFLAFPAIDALARCDDPQVAAVLISLLDNDLLRAAAIDTLGAVGDEECVGPLTRLLDDEETAAGAVAAALVRLQTRYDAMMGAGEQVADLARRSISERALQRVIAAVRAGETPRRDMVTLLGWMGERATDTLIESLDDEEVRAVALEALEHIGRGVVPPLVSQFEQLERDARVSAVSLLGRLGDRRALPILTPLLRSLDAELVTAAIAALATIGDAGPLDELFALFSHELPGVRQAAVAAVNAIGSASTETRVRQLLADERPGVRESAVRVAGYFGFPSTALAIVAASRHENEGVRRAAIEQLPLLSHPEADARLVEAMHHDAPRNRAVAAHAARAADSDDVETALVASLDDIDSWVRYYAVISLAERGCRAAAVRIAELATSDSVPPVRIAARRALGELDPARALGVAQQSLGTADDDEAGAALAALWSADDVRADRLLATALAGANQNLRRTAVQTLARRPSLATIETLAFAVQMAEPPDLSASAIAGLSDVIAASDAETAAAGVEALLAIGLDAALRGHIIAALAALPARVIPDVARALGDARLGVRLTAIGGLARMRHPDASAALVRALHDEVPAARAAAISAFGQLGSTVAMQTICRLRQSDADATVRRRAALVCERHGWSA